MYKKNIFLLLCMLFILSSAHAATITWVAQNWDADGDGVNDSNEWVVKLQAEGYDVDFKTDGYWNAITADKATELNASDLVIIAGNIQSGEFGSDAAEVANWNSVTAPMLNCNPYLLRSTRWKWVDNGDGELPENNGDQGSPDMVAVQPSHPIFYGITLQDNKVKAIDPDLGSGHASFIGTDKVGNGTLIAKPEGNDWIWVAEWQKGVDFYSGGAKANGHRMYISIGYHEATGLPARGYNLTNEGWEIFLNTIRYMLGESINPGLARSPSPANGEGEIVQDPILSWKPGTITEKHNVFFGTDVNDVTNATISEPLSTTVSSGQPLDANYFDPGLLDFGTTYYWRVDEVNGAPDYGINKGNVWSFTVEKAALDMPLEKIVKVTASNSMEGNDPNNTINGAGLGVDPNFPNAHSNGTGMWAANLPVAPNNVWIQYDFDKKYKIHDMQVWNYNRSFFMGYGFKDVLVQYSEDGGQTWTDLPDVNQFAKANGLATYDTVAQGENNFAFNGAIANSVRITALSHWEGGISPTFNAGYGLSEVRFTYVPLRARKQSIEDGAENVSVTSILKWRAGREAKTHELYIDINETNVENASINPITLNDSVYAPDLSLADTYYWRVDEVNPNMTPSVWEGYVWSFSTPNTILVDGFETGYGNDVDKNAVFLTWIDGENDSDNGAWMGRDDEPYLHTINHSGGHSAPFNFDNAGVDYSEVTADTSELLNGSDWSLGNPKTLTIWFRGDPNNDEVGDSQLYCKIGGTKVVYAGSIDILAQDIWRQWDIDLTGMSLSNVPSLTIGVETIGSVDGYGTIYLDDIMLTGFESTINYDDIYIEAEAFTITEPLEVNDAEVGDIEASGGEYIHVKNGTTASTKEPPTDGIATYEVDLDGGQYILWGRVSIAVAANDSFWVKVDNATPDVDLDPSGWCKWNEVQQGENWHWAQIHSNIAEGNNPVVTWTIPAGTTTISIAYRESHATTPPRLDKLMIQKVGE